jgi:hypothetical protein
LIHYLASRLDLSWQRASQKKHLLQLGQDRIQGSTLLIESNFQSHLDKLAEQPSSMSISGYFQDYCYLDEEISQVSSIIRQYFQSQGNGRDKRYGAIHVRLGDFRSLSAIYGEVDPCHYDRALLEIQKDGYVLGGNVLFVSDELDSALQLLPSIVSKVGTVQSQIASTNPVDDLATLSNADWIVASSSTFAWWAAQIGGGIPIFLPTPFLVNQRKNAKVNLNSPNTRFIERTAR